MNKCPFVYSMENQVCDNGLRPNEAEHVEITARSVVAEDAMSDLRWPAPEGHI